MNFYATKKSCDKNLTELYTNNLWQYVKCPLYVNGLKDLIVVDKPLYKLFGVPKLMNYMELKHYLQSRLCRKLSGGFVRLFQKSNLLTILK